MPKSLLRFFTNAPSNKLKIREITLSVYVKTMTIVMLFNLSSDINVGGNYACVARFTCVCARPFDYLRDFIAPSMECA